MAASSCHRSLPAFPLQRDSHRLLYASERCSELPALNCFPPSLLRIQDAKNGLRIDEKRISSPRDLFGNGIDEEF